MAFTANASIVIHAIEAPTALDKPVSQRSSTRSQLDSACSLLWHLVCCDSTRTETCWGGTESSGGRETIDLSPASSPTFACWGRPTLPTCLASSKSWIRGQTMEMVTLEPNKHRKDLDCSAACKIGRSPLVASPPANCRVNMLSIHVSLALRKLTFYI